MRLYKVLPILGITTAAIVIGTFSYVSFANIKFSIFSSSGESGSIQKVEAVSLPADLDLISAVNEKSQGTLYGGFLLAQDNAIDTQRNCEFCTIIEYSPGLSSNNMEIHWTMDRNYDIGQAKKITFYAMGYGGGENVIFKSVGKKHLDANGMPLKNPTFEISTKPVILKKAWQKFEIDISKANNIGVTDPFGISFGKNGNVGPVTIYVKGLRLESTPAINNALELESVSPQ